MSCVRMLMGSPSIAGFTARKPVARSHDQKAVPNVLIRRRINVGCHRFTNSCRLTHYSSRHTCMHTLVSLKPKSYSNDHLPRRSFSDHGTIQKNNQSITFSDITETPFHSNVTEKPYTLILMEDNDQFTIRPTAVNRRICADEDDNEPANSSGIHDHILRQKIFSWADIFRSKIPSEYGMSFATLTWSATSDHAIPSIGLGGMKCSPLPTISDAVLVTRGPLSSLCAQYYLESYSLKGLIMIDPVLVPDSDENWDKTDRDKLFSIIKHICLQREDEWSRFHSSRLRLEHNAVPMIVFMTVSNNSAWNAASRFVAERHGKADGLHGNVPVVDLTRAAGLREDVVEEVIAKINAWVDHAIF